MSHLYIFTTMNNNIESNWCERIPRIGWTLLNPVSEFVLLCGFSIGSCCHWCQWFDYLGYCWIICHLCKWFDWLMSSNWLIDDWWTMDMYYPWWEWYMSKWKPIDKNGSLIWCIDEDGSMSCHWYMMMHSLFDEKMDHYCLIMIELQSGPLMVKSLTGRCFAIELS